MPHTTSTMHFPRQEVFRAAIEAGKAGATEADNPYEKPKKPTRVHFWWVWRSGVRHGHRMRAEKENTA